MNWSIYSIPSSLADCDEAYTIYSGLLSAKEALGSNNTLIETYFAPIRMRMDDIASKSYYQPLCDSDEYFCSFTSGSCSNDPTAGYLRSTYNHYLYKASNTSVALSSTAKIMWIK